jgi:hemerythrin
VRLFRSALDELDEYGRWEFGLEEAALDHSCPEDRTSHHQEHVVLLEKLRDLRRSIDDGVERLRDRERADLCDRLSNWLVHALSEQTPWTAIKAESSGRGFSLYA